MKNLLIALAFLAAASQLFSQPEPPARQRQDPEVQRMREEMRTWFRTDVLPQLQQWHREYDASLSSDDLSKLNQLRAQVKELKKAMREDTGNLKGRYKTEMKKIIEEVKPIAKASKERLRAIFDENEEQIDAWREEFHERREAIREQCGRSGKHRGGNGHADEFGMLLGDGKRAAMAFILWDGEMPVDPPQKKGSPKRTGSLNVMPNPSSGSATVRMMDLPSGPATMELLDMNGNVIRSKKVMITDNVLDESISTSELAAGTYMISVNTSSGRRSTSLIIEK